MLASSAVPCKPQQATEVNRALQGKYFVVDADLPDMPSISETRRLGQHTDPES